MLIQATTVHAYNYRELGWQGLVDEMELEITRISSRNLGRDDRYSYVY